MFPSLEMKHLPWSLRFCGKPLEELSKEELIEVCKATYQMYESARRNHQATLDFFKSLQRK